MKWVCKPSLKCTQVKMPPHPAARCVSHLESKWRIIFLFRKLITMDIQGKVFIVTGGASGLGEGTARHLAQLGGKVLVADMQIGRAHV